MGRECRGAVAGIISGTSGPKLKFGPLPGGLRKGDAIVWVNRDILKHSATAADHSFDADLPAGSKIRTVIRHSGAIPFVCRYHPGMRGTLQVK